MLQTVPLAPAAPDKKLNTARSERIAHFTSNVTYYPNKQIWESPEVLEQTERPPDMFGQGVHELVPPKLPAEKVLPVQRSQVCLALAD